MGKQYTYGKGMKQLSDSGTVTFAGRITKKVSEFGKRIDKVSLIKLVEEYKKTCPVSIVLECFGVKHSTFYRWKHECKNSQKKVHDK